MQTGWKYIEEEPPTVPGNYVVLECSPDGYSVVYLCEFDGKDFIDLYSDCIRRPYRYFFIPGI